jgi:AcrR family transcriptional regulator
MVSRERILEAAARVYAKYGFKGATTRLIAIEAEVNEVTLFRTFGSKGALLEAVLMQHVSAQEPPILPEDPRDPPAELCQFVEANLRKISEMRPLLIHTMGEMGDRPDAHEFACRGRHQVHDTITTYIRHLGERGWADPHVDADTAAVMLTGTVMSDVMGRQIVPDVYPPREEVAARYTALFLRSIGYRGQTGVGEPSTVQAGATAGHIPTHSPA